MERKQGFFSALKEEVVRGLSPSRSRAKSPARSLPSGSTLRHRKKNRRPAKSEQFSGRSGGLRPAETLSPLKEGPDGGDSRIEGKWGHWMKGQLCRAPPVSCTAYKRSDLRLLLGVLGAPLSPIQVSSVENLAHLSIKDTPIETSSAHYILQQYTAASGGQKAQNSIHNAYAIGKVRMIASEFETANRVVKSRNSAKAAELGEFVLWQMNPDMWYIELALSGSKVHAGCNGRLVWRHTPWLGAHAAKGPVRPLRRALQGLDPKSTASLFANSKCIGEKKINGEDCFILKLSADPMTLKARSEGPAEIIRHVLFGYFSQKTGLLIHIEDSHLTRIQNNGGDAVYWETTINSFMDNYRPIDGIMIAHSGRSVVTLFRFGETAMSHTKTRMEEAWTIEEVAFNVRGLSMDCFIPPAELRFAAINDAYEIHQAEGQSIQNAVASAAYHSSRVTTTLDKYHDSNGNNLIWKTD